MHKCIILIITNSRSIRINSITRNITYVKNIKYRKLYASEMLLHVLSFYSYRFQKIQLFYILDVNEYVIAHILHFVTVVDSGSIVPLFGKLTANMNKLIIFTRIQENDRKINESKRTDRDHSNIVRQHMHML